MTASLFPRIHASRRLYPEDCWPKIRKVRDLDAIARDQLSDSSQVLFDGWHHSCTQVLPVHSEDSSYEITTAGALIRYLAEEHASLLHRFQPVRIVYGPDRDPVVTKALNDEDKKSGI